MKAKVRDTGEIIEVERILETTWIDINSTQEKSYYESELDFGDTREGWLTVGESVVTFHESPPFLADHFMGSWWKSEGRSYHISRDLFPFLSPENSPKKVRISIKLLEE